MNDKQKKLMLVQDVVDELAKKGVVLTPNAVRARLRNSMMQLASESCKALGVELDDEALERVSASRAFQEAVASVLGGEDA